MQPQIPSRTALRVAMRRAAHQVFDAEPLVLVDPFALRILPAEAAAEVRADENHSHPVARGIRAFMVARSRFAEDAFTAAFERGVSQYVLLGAGLDTFAWRNPFAGLGVRVFEVDHPDTQAWKRELIRETGMQETCAHYVPVDFEKESLGTRLADFGFDHDRPAFFTWLGVVPYLTLAAFRATLCFLGGCVPGSGLALDYSIPREAMPERERSFFDFMAGRVAQAGEPFRLFLLPDQIREELSRVGWQIKEDLDGIGLHERFFRDRCDGLGLRGRAGRLLHACKPG